MKINWGVGITISIIVFTIISIGFMFFAFNQEVNLVREDYYEAEVKFDDKMEIVNRTNQLDDKIRINSTQGNIEIIFPKNLQRDKITGNILLYRSSDRNLDFTLPIRLDSSNVQLISSAKLIRGMWKIQISWQVDSLKYFNEKVIMVD